MSSSLPTDSGLPYDKAVKALGIGTYDSPLDTDLHGEDSENTKPRGESLPGTSISVNPSTETMTSYTTNNSSLASLISDIDDLSYLVKFTQKISKSELPGDHDLPPRAPKPEEKTIIDTVPTSNGVIVELKSGLPSGEPVARSDYYDRSVSGSSIDDVWSDADTGAYVSNEMTPGTGIPYIPTNDVSLDDYLSALGNAWSGYVTEDNNVSPGFPNPDFKENSVFEKSNDGSLGVIVASCPSNEQPFLGKMQKISTNIELVDTLTGEFIEEYGKKDLVRRHIVAFLQKRNLPQYLASDIVRCLKFRHSVTIPDVMDLFPLVKTASKKDFTLSKIHDQLIDLWIKENNLKVSHTLRNCAIKIAKAIFDLESR